MASISSTAPPTYEDWLKLIKIWRCLTELPAKSQGSGLALPLEDEALDVVLKIDEAEIAGENGVNAIITRLNCLFNKDSTITKYQAFESFMKFNHSIINHSCLSRRFLMSLTNACLKQKPVVQPCQMTFWPINY